MSDSIKEIIYTDEERLAMEIPHADDVLRQVRKNSIESLISQVKTEIGAMIKQNRMEGHVALESYRKETIDKVLDILVTKGYTFTVGQTLHGRPSNLMIKISSKSYSGIYNGI